MDHIYNMTLNFGDKKIMQIGITYKNFRTEPSGKLPSGKLHDPVNPFYEDLKILKFKDLLHLQNCLFVSQIEENQTLGKSFATLKDCGDNHNYQTRASTKRILDTPLYKTNTWVFVLIQQNIIVLRIETSLKESSLTSQKLTILIENLNH